MPGPLIALGSRFLELLLVIEAWSFISLWLPDAVRRVIYAPGSSSGEVVLVERSSLELLWPDDIILGVGGTVALSGHWRAFTLGHRRHVGGHLIFRFRLGTLEASVRIFTTGGICRTFP
jgi:hypothetical protein